MRWSTFWLAWTAFWTALYLTISVWSAANGLPGQYIMYLICAVLIYNCGFQYAHQRRIGEIIKEKRTKAFRDGE